MAKQVLCVRCHGTKCDGPPIASAQFNGSSVVMKVGVKCADAVIAWNEKSDRHGLARVV